MADVGLKISITDVDATTATGQDILMNFSNPFMLLDSQKPVSFQNIDITFLNDPPNPDGISNFTQDTTIYTFAHGYTYIPATWLLFLNANNPTFKYGYAGGLIASEGAVSGGLLLYKVDATNVYIIVRKFFQTGFGILPTSIVGKNVKLRLYVFANDIGVTT